jgi:hypothetical protein
MNGPDHFCPDTGPKIFNRRELPGNAYWNPPSLLDFARDLSRRPLQEVSTRLPRGDETDWRGPAGNCPLEGSVGGRGEDSRLPAELSFAHGDLAGVTSNA